MKCGNCNEEIGASKFCPNCGTAQVKSGTAMMTDSRVLKALAIGAFIGALVGAALPFVSWFMGACIGAAVVAFKKLT